VLFKKLIRGYLGREIIQEINVSRIQNSQTQRLMPIILATWEAKIRRIAV
jgi:hypothetical protein